MPTRTATVHRITAGRLRDINDKKVLVEADADDGTVTAYWCPADEAPPVGTRLNITVTTED